MKRIILTLIAISTLVGGVAQLQDMLPSTVQLFLEERAMNRQLHSISDSNAANQYSLRFAPTRMVHGTEMVDVFISYDQPNVIPTLKAHGVLVNSMFDDFITAQAPIDQLIAISRINGVTNVEVSGVAELCTDSTLNVTHAGQVLAGTSYGLPQAYDGTGVIIGMIDTGYDYQHTAFRRTDDTTQTRIMRVYDPNNSKGHPAYVDGNRLPGSIFMNEQIDTLTTDATEQTHGTHTTGVAAGRHVNGYGGMAPGAEIVMCVSRNMHSGISEAEIINCIKYIYAYADSVGKPCVVNISMSNRFGAHDGKDKLSKAVAKCTGPGRIFVVAAGNNGIENGYACGPALADKPLNMLIGYFYPPGDESYYYLNTWMTTWVRATQVQPVVQFHILDKKTRHIVWESELFNISRRIDVSEINDYFMPKESNPNESYMKGHVGLDMSNWKYEVSCEFKNLMCKDFTTDQWGNITSRYQIGLSIYPPSVLTPNKPDSCYIDSWICTANGRRTTDTSPVYRDIITENGETITQRYDNFYTNGSNRCSVGTYTVHDSIISVGGYIGRNKFFSMPDNQIVEFEATIGNYWSNSSYEYPGYGPTGKALPTVTAPSYNVVSSANHLAGINEMTTNTVMKWGKDYWGAMTGTSMAAPAVAGIIAQWLQINPDLSPSQVKDVIAHTAIKDSFSQNSVRFGPNGKIDAMAGARYLLGIEEPELVIGDVNGDGEINITDVTWLIDFLLGMEHEGFVIAVADVFPDNEINIRDLTGLVDTILNNGM